MTSTELRIGNKVYFGERRITVTYHDIGNMRKQELSGFSHNYRPIPLTADILTEKAGFEEWPDGYELNGIVIKINPVDKSFYLAYPDVQPDIPWVHTLQNLYALLVEEELEVAL